MAKKASKKSTTSAKKKTAKSKKTSTVPKAKKTTAPKKAAKAASSSAAKVKKSAVKPTVIGDKKPVVTTKSSKKKIVKESKTQETSAIDNGSNASTSKFIPFAWAIAAIIIFSLAAFVGIPYIYKQTSLGQIWLEERDLIAFEERQEDARENADEETDTFGFEGSEEFKVVFNIEVEDEDTRTINGTLRSEWAPETVENFVRLSDRDLYDDTYFYRYVEETNFTVIQGTDIQLSTGEYAVGRRFQTADGEILVDEIWTDAGEGNFRAPEAYRDYDSESGQVTMPKGSIAMAKGTAANSATSQFFIVLEDTILPAQYTTFGTVDEASIEGLDFLREVLEPVSNDELGITEPSKEVVLLSVDIEKL